MSSCANCVHALGGFTDVRDLLCCPSCRACHSNCGPPRGKRGCCETCQDLPNPDASRAARPGSATASRHRPRRHPVPAPSRCARRNRIRSFSTALPAATAIDLRRNWPGSRAGARPVVVSSPSRGLPIVTHGRGRPAPVPAKESSAEPGRAPATGRSADRDGCLYPRLCG